MGNSPDKSMAAGIEREYKFDVDADFDPPDLRSVVGRSERLADVEQRSTYFDTADHRLWSRGITFRHRSVTSGADAESAGGEWTLKLPVDPSPAGPAGAPAEESSRTELSWRGPIGAVPEEARLILAGLVRRAGLSPVAELSALRRRLLLHETGPGQAWGEIDDDLVSVTAGVNAGQRFRQIELELLGEAAPPRVELEAVLSRLRSSGAEPGGGSKLGIALGLPPAAAAPTSEASRPGGPSSADTVRRVVSEDLAALLECDYRLRRAAVAGSGPDSALVRRSRAAVRRTRDHLRTFQPVLDPIWCRHVRAELRSFDRALGLLRDADVLLERLRAHDEADDRDGVAELVRLLVADRALAAADLDGYMRTSAYIDLLGRLHAATDAPPLLGRGGRQPGRGASRSAARRLASRRWRDLVAHLDRLPSEPGADDLRRVAVRARRLRYAAEAAVPSMGKRARRTRDAAGELQGLLGEIDDAAAAVSWLRQIASHPSLAPADAFVAGRLAGRLEVGAQALREALPGVIRSVKKKKASSWLK